MKRKLTLFLFTLSFLLVMSFGRPVSAQDVVFSQFYASPSVLNPAFAGNTYSPFLTLNYRNQWSSIFNAYVTYSASYSQLIEPLNSGIGITILADRAGDGIYRSTGFNVQYSYRVNIKDDIFLKGGVQAGSIQVALDWDKLIFLDELDPVSGPVNETQEERPEQLTNTKFDASAGLLIYGRRFYAGFSLHHLNTPDLSLLDSEDDLTAGLPMRFTLHGGAEINLTNQNNIQKFEAFVSPNILYTKQGEFNQVNVGAYFGIGPVNLGAWFRHTFGNADAAIFSLGYGAGVFKLGYSYDWTVSELSAQSNGSHEVSLIINMDKDEKNKRRRRNREFNDCFRMFR